MLLDRSHREFFWLLVRRDLKVRYAGSTLGGLWNIIHPLVMIAIYMTIFSTVMRDRNPAVGTVKPYYASLAYGVHLCAGLIPWLLFSDVLVRSAGALLENSNFLQKVSFPPLVLFASIFFNALIIHGSGYLCFLGILGLLGKLAPLSALCGLGIMFLFGLSALGLGMMLAGLNVFFRDTAQVLAIVMQLLFWLNPIVYFKEYVLRADASAHGLVRILVNVGRLLVTLNPFERFVSTTQWLMGHELAVFSLAPLDWAIVGLFPLICLAAGLYLFRRMLPDVRDCL